MCKKIKYIGLDSGERIGYEAFLQRLLDRGDRCWICNRGIDWSIRELRGSLDHIVPRSKGGKDSEGNLKLAHFWCNSSRGDKKVSEGMRRKFRRIVRGILRDSIVKTSEGINKVDKINKVDNYAEL